MRLSTRSRYGTRLVLDLAERHGEGAIQLGDIARRQEVSQKYLEQIVKPLKKAGVIKGIRGARGGYVLSRAPKDIRVGEVVALLEGGAKFCDCTEDREICSRSDSCQTRELWTAAAEAMYEKLNEVSFHDLVVKGRE